MFAPRRSLSATPAADPELAGPHPHTETEKDARMLSFIHPDLLWVALAFIFSMAGMLATYPE